MGLFSRKPASDQREIRVTDSAVETYIKNKLVTISYQGDGIFEQRVVGLNYHDDECAAVLRVVDDINSGREEMSADLIREPTNPYDRNAIRVDILGNTVGYIPADVAASMAQRLDARGRNIEIRCPALITWSPVDREIRTILLDVAYDPQAKTRQEERDRRAATAQETASSALDSGTIVEIWGAGSNPRGEILGESSYASHICSVICERTGETSFGDSGLETDAIALIIDSGDEALAFIDGSPVGYLPAETLAPLAAAIKSIATSGCVPAIRARLWASEAIASVSLDLGDPDLMVPINALADAGVVELPTGRSIQVTGEETHMDVLVPLLGGASQVSAWATLVAATTGSGKSEKRVVEVQINGNAVGQLTAGMSAELLPTLDHLLLRQFGAAVRATVKGNRVKVDVSICASKSGDIPESWFDSLPG